MDWVQVYSGVLFGIYILNCARDCFKSSSYFIASIIALALPLPLFLRVWGVL